MAMRLRNLWIGATFSVLGIGCGGKRDSQAYDLVPPRDPLDCVVPLPATGPDGKPWPSYSEKLAEFQNCGGSESTAGFYYAEDQTCADGKHMLATASGFSDASYYYQDEALVGLSRSTDLLTIDPNGCAYHPEGTREGVTCDVVSSTQVDNCLSERVCEPGLSRCESNELQVCADDGSAWATLQVCASATLCDARPPARCNPA